MSELETATLDELVAEVKRRVAGMVMFCETGPDSENTDGLFWYYSKGSLSMVLGMLVRGNIHYKSEAALLPEVPRDDEEDGE